MPQSRSLRTLTITSLCVTVIVMSSGCGGGGDIDFSKPPGGLPSMQSPPAQPNAAQPATPAPGQPAPSTNDQPSTTRGATANKTVANQNSGKSTRPVSLSLGGSKKPDPDAPARTDATAENLVGVPPVRIITGRSNRAFRKDDDEDDPTKWRTNKFQLSANDEHYLRYLNRVAISETGELTAGIDNATGEILIFESRFGQVRALFRISEAAPVAVAVSQANEQVMVLDSMHHLHVFDVPDLTLFDVFARRDFLRKQVARAPLKVTNERVSGMQASPSGEQLIIATDGGNVEIRSLDSRPADKPDWPATFRIEAHDSAIFAVAMADDESQLVTAAADGSVKVWNVKSQECVAELPKVNVPAFSLCPVQNGFAIGRATGTVEAWVDPGKDSSEIKEFYDQYDIAVTSLMVEPKKGLLVRGRMNGSTNLLNMTSGEVVLTRKPFQSPVTAMSPWPDHGRLLAAGLGGRYTSWDVPLFREKQQFGDDEGSAAINKPVNAFYVAKLAPSLSRRKNATVDDDDDVPERSKKQELALREFREGWKEIGRADGAALAELRKVDETGRQEFRDQLKDQSPVIQQDAKQLDLRFEQPLDLNNFNPKDVRLTLSESGETLVIATPPGPLQTGFIETWDVPSGKLLRRWTTDRKYASLRLVADGKWLIPIPVRDRKRRQESIGYYDLRTGLSVGSPADPQCVAVSDSGKIGIGFPGRYRESTIVASVYEPDEMKPVGRLTMFETRIPAMCFIGEDELVLSLRERSRARLAVATISGVISEKIVLHEETKRIVPWVNAGGLVDNELPGVTDIIALGNSGNLATNGQYENNDYRFAIWKRKGGRYPKDDANGARKNSRFLREAAIGASRMCAPKNGVITVLTEEGAAMVDAVDGKVLSELKLERTDKALLDRNGKWLVVGDAAGTIRVATPAALKSSPREFRGHDGPVLTMAFSEGGGYLASLGEEGVVKVWELSDKPRAKKEQH